MHLTRHLFSAPSRLLSALASVVSGQSLKLRTPDYTAGVLSEEILTDIGVSRWMLMAGPGYADMVELSA